MTAHQVPPTPSRPPPRQIALTRSRSLTPSTLLTPCIIAQPGTMQELLCRWVPGTTNMVRLTIGVGQTDDQIIELNITRLSRIFGREVMHDLYLKGRAQVSADPQQIAFLLELQP